MLFPDASYRAEITNKISNSFESYGYFLIDPPIMEFESSLFDGSGRVLKKKSFRLMDPVSQKMLAIRPDMTLQVARIAKYRLKQSRTIRLSYVGQVLRVNGKGLYAERQLTQAGIEMIGKDSAIADAEIVLVAIDTLKKIGVKEICIDFTIPNLASTIIGSMDFPQKEKKQLASAVDKKDIDTIEKLTGEKNGTLVRLLSIDMDIEQLAKMKLPKEVRHQVSRLEEVVGIVKKKESDVTILVDPVEASRFGYYSGIGFSIFSKDAKSELGRGGRYTIDYDDNVSENSSSSAVGFTFYVDELFRIIAKPEENNLVFVPIGTKKEYVDAVRSKGMVTIYELEGFKDKLKEARDQKCSFILNGGELTPII